MYKKHMYTSFWTSICLSHIRLRFKRPSLVHFAWRKPLWASSSSAYIFSFKRYITIFNSSYVTWLVILIVLYSWRLLAFGFLGICMNIDSFRYVSQYPVLYILVHNCVHCSTGLTLSASLLRSSLCQLLCCSLIMWCHVSPPSMLPRDHFHH